MLLLLWNYLKGYVIIRVSGFSVERFVNLAAFKNIYIWDVRRETASVTMKVSIKGFKALRDCAAKTGCRYKILERRGLPFRVKKYEKRKALSLGALAFVAGLYILSSFVWTIDISGNEKISSQELKLALSEMGLRPGTFKKNVDLDKITENLLVSFSDISWVSVKIKGTDAIISIAEAIPKPKMLDKNTANDIIAAKDSVIVSCVVSAGTPLVSAGDVVKAGDVLISSRLLIMEGDEVKGEQYTAARGEVFARVWYDIAEEEPLSFTERTYTGAVKYDSSLIIGDSEVNLIRPSGPELYESREIYEKRLAIGDFELPLALKKQEYLEYADKERTITEDEAKEALSAKISAFLDGLPLESQVESIETEYERIGGIMRAKARASVVERIDEIREITPESNDGENTGGSEAQLEQDRING